MRLTSSSGIVHCTKLKKKKKKGTIYPFLLYSRSILYLSCHSKDRKKENQFRLKSPESPIGQSCLSKFQNLVENNQDFVQAKF